MDYTEIILTVPSQSLEAAESIANMAVHYGIYTEDYSNLEQDVFEITRLKLIDEELLQKDRDKGLIHIYIDAKENPDEAVAFLKERLSAAGIIYEVAIKTCREEDWANNWKKYYHPIEIGKKLLICPAWIEAANTGGRAVLKLEPGMAFGTGTHETTRLCLELLERYVKAGDHMLDVGCGSGILSVSALLLGAAGATAVDIDALAVATAKENAENNGVGDRFLALEGNLTDMVTGTFDMITANIVADIILALNKAVENFLKSGGIYIMSGIIDSREDEILSSLDENFEIMAVFREKGWSAIAAKMK